MAGVTASSMHDARDAEDIRLLEAGEKKLLVEGYYGVVIDRCRVGVRDPERALDVAGLCTGREVPCILAVTDRGAIEA